MATRKYSIDVGASEETITETVGLATTKGLELTVDLGKFPDRMSVLAAIQRLGNYIAEDTWPPV